jgi:predicted nucleic acid-binding protein
MSLVLDSSAVLSWLLDEEAGEPMTAVMMRIAILGAIVPGIWFYEVANGLQMAVRRKRIDTEYRDGAVERLIRLKISADGLSDTMTWSATLALSHRYGLTVYDAAFLELAERRRLPLATLDAALAAAAQNAGVELALAR